MLIIQRSRRNRETGAVDSLAVDDAGAGRRLAVDHGEDEVSGAPDDADLAWNNAVSRLKYFCQYLDVNLKVILDLRKIKYPKQRDYDMMEFKIGVINDAIQRLNSSGIFGVFNVLGVRKLNQPWIEFREAIEKKYYDQANTKLKDLESHAALL